jgi:hypothetical protein
MMVNLLTAVLPNCRESLKRSNRRENEGVTRGRFDVTKAWSTLGVEGFAAVLAKAGKWVAEAEAELLSEGRQLEGQSTCQGWGSSRLAAGLGRLCKPLEPI